MWSPSGQLNGKQQNNIFNTIFASPLSLTFRMLFLNYFNASSLLDFALRVVFFCYNYPSIILYVPPFIFHSTCLCYLCSHSLFSFIIVAEMTKLLYPPLLLGFSFLETPEIRLKHIHVNQRFFLYNFLQYIQNKITVKLQWNIFKIYTEKWNRRRRVNELFAVVNWLLQKKMAIVVCCYGGNRTTVTGVVKYVGKAPPGDSWLAS